MNINASCTLGSILGTGETIYGVAGWVCRNLDESEENVALFTCLNPSASYTLTIKGGVFFGRNSAFRAGTSSNPIPCANKFIIQGATPTV